MGNYVITSNPLPIAYKNSSYNGAKYTIGVLSVYNVTFILTRRRLCLFIFIAK